jgi:arsenite methyltransferase
MKKMDGTNEFISPEEIRINVREHYAGIAEKGQTGCCPSPANDTASSCCGTEDNSSALEHLERLYQVEDMDELPTEVTDLSLGCGDPVTLASLQPGQTVLDLGSGGGIDCFLAAKRVAPNGRVIGVDMTPQMIDRARANKEKLGAENVEFRLGEIEHLPVADNSMDVVISNCVINLSPDKPQVFREAYRVLKPGGRLAVSDIVTDGPLPEVVKQNLSSWAGCVAGALDQTDYVQSIQQAGFEEVNLTPVYWDQSIVDEALDQLKIHSEIKEGHRIMAYLEGDEVNLIDLGESDGGDQDWATKAIFSAKVVARKPKIS